MVTTPSQRALAAEHHPVEPLARAKARAASSLWVWTRASFASASVAEAVVRPAHVEPAGRQRESSGRRIAGRHGSTDRGRALDRVVDALQRHPGAGEARHGDAEQAVVEDLLHAGRVQHRHHARRPRVSLWCAVVLELADWSSPSSISTPPCRAVPEIAVADRVAGAIDARALAVPDREHAVVAALAVEPDLLRAEQAVAARSSLTPGRWTIWCASSCAFARAICWS